MRVLLAAAAAVLCVLAASAAALSLDLKLQPVGQGKDTHASWLGGIGEPDGFASQTFALSNGSADGDGSAAWHGRARRHPHRARARFYDQTIGSILVDNISVATKLGSQTWTCAADNGNKTVVAGAFTAEQLTFLAQPFSFDELTYVDDLIASATVEEWSAISDGS